MGRFIRFDPGGKPANSSALQNAILENNSYPENAAGKGAKVDMEFTGTNKNGRCVAATVAQCIGK